MHMPQGLAFLIDGTAFCYRAFYAVRGLATSQGRPTNAVYGFAVMLRSLLEQHHPAYLAVAFDVGKPTFRHRQFAEYKIQRKPMPDPLIEQLSTVKALLQAYRIPVFEREGYEAEDVLATIAREIATVVGEVWLVSGDKDVLQLVKAHVKVYNPHQHDEALIDRAVVRKRYGVDPEQMVDLMALMGDATDNIPGVAGIGAATARQLLEQFESVDNLYRQLPEVTSVSRRKVLEEGRRQMEVSRELARIHDDVPIDVELEHLKVREPDWKALRALFRELEFKRLLKDLEDHAPASSAASPAVRLVDSPEAFEHLSRQLAHARMAAVVGWGAAPAMSLALAADSQEAWLVRVDREGLHGIAQGLISWLADPSAAKISHDGKTLMRGLRGIGLELRGLVGDTMIAAHLANPARTTQGLADLLDEVLDIRLKLPEAMDEVTMPSMATDCAAAVCAVFNVHEHLTKRLDELGLMVLYRELELPLLEVLAEMEVDGVAIDVTHLSRLRDAMEQQLARLHDEITDVAGGAFNLNSPRQLAQVLFEQLKLPVIKRTKTGPSTDSDVLQHLAKQHPLPKRLMEYRELAKLRSTYVDALPTLVDPATGRLHTTFNQTATATGRLSSSSPNLQNIPVKTELGRQIRQAFVPRRSGWMFMAADYSQIELRILAHLSGDHQLITAFANGRDIHRCTASLVYGIPETDVTAEMRSAMKAVNFGILYGMSAHGLSRELGLPYEESAAFINAYFERYPGVRSFFDRQIQQATTEGFVQTLLGRRRYLPELASHDPAIRQLGQRLAMNTPIQGTAADLIKRAMIEIAAALRAQRMASRMVLQVHDELVFDAPPDERDSLAAMVRRIMEGAIMLNVPLLVTIKTGPNWLDLTEWT
ncbi:MAG: DNA polymerase I [Candidatus Omnitrophica bacterium]|nr:DNA polymerase I [Candidatus Omnitrophota bacterium]